MNIYNYLVNLALSPISQKNEKNTGLFDSLESSSDVKHMLCNQGYEEIYGDKQACETRAPDL